MNIKKIAPLKSLNIQQSYNFSVARYKLSVYEKRVLYQTTAYIQDELKKGTLEKSYVYQQDNFLGLKIPISVANVMTNQNDEHYTRIKTALKSLSKKHIEIENDQIWKSINIIAFPEIIKNQRMVNFILDKDMFRLLLDYGKGFRKFELNSVMKLSTVYAMRFYELFSKQSQSTTLNIETLKNRFSLSNKYSRNSDFVKEIVERAKKELDKKSPYSFTYIPLIDKKIKNAKGGRPKIKAIKFTPVYLVENSDKKLSEKEYKHELRQKIPIRAYVSQELESILKEKGLTDQGIKNNLEILHKFKRLKLKLSNRTLQNADNAENPPGYIIATMQIMVDDAIIKKQKIEQISKQEQQTSIFSSGTLENDIDIKKLRSDLDAMFKGENVSNQSNGDNVVKTILIRANKTKKPGVKKQVVQIEDAVEVPNDPTSINNESSSPKESTTSNVSSAKTTQDTGIKPDELTNVKEVIPTPSISIQQLLTSDIKQNNIEFKAVFQNYLHSKEIDGKYADLISLANTLDLKFDSATISSIHKKKHFINYVKEKTDYKHYKELKKSGLKGDILYSTLTQKVKNEPINHVKESIPTLNKTIQQPTIQNVQSNDVIEFQAIYQKYLNNKEIDGKYADLIKLSTTLDIKLDAETIRSIHKKKQFIRLLEEKTFYKKYKTLKKGGADGELLYSTLRKMSQLPASQNIEPFPVHTLTAKKPKFFKRLFLKFSSKKWKNNPQVKP